MRQRGYYCWILLVLAALCGRIAWADAYDPPTHYYDSATGAGPTLKQQLHDIIKNHTALSYDAARANLQVSDADPNQSGHMITVYDRTSLNLAPLSASGISGWDPDVWNREHTWPRSRSVGSSGPDDSDMFELRPALTANNGDRGELSFGGAFGQPYGVVTDGGQSFWYPGDAEAGMIARQEFYMAVRYDGTDANTLDLELGVGFVANPSGDTDPPPQLGNLTRLLEWHYAAPPDSFERRRNQIIFDNFQHNRDPFVDHPEYVWSVLAKDTSGNALLNDSQIAISGVAVNGNGVSTRTVDLGSVFAGASVPAAQSFTLTKSGSAGTYFEVTASGAATSSISGRLNAMRMNQTDSKPITVGLSTSTATAGLKSGTVTIDNLDITTGGAAGRGVTDGNDTFNVSLTVLDHATPSFTSPALATTLSHDFGNIAIGSSPSSFNFSVYNLLATVGFTANMDFDSVTPSGSTSAFSTNLADSAGSLVLAGGASQAFASSFVASAVGTFSASYMLNFSDENIASALNKSITLTLSGKMRLAGDYNGDLKVDASDYTVWRNTMGQFVTAYSSADGDGNGKVEDPDFNVWRAHFGQTASASGAGLATDAVPEPAGYCLVVSGLLFGALRRRDRNRFAASACK